MGKFVGDGFVTTKEVLRRAKENKVLYIGRIKKRWIVEVFGKKFRIEELFEKEKLCKRTVEGKEFLLTSKVVNIPEVGRVKIVKCMMEDKKELYYLVSTNWRKKPENIIKEYLKRFWIEEKHRRDKSILKLEGNYLRSEKSNNGFILLMTALANCIEFLSHKLGATFYDVVSLCSVEIIRHLLT